MLSDRPEPESPIFLQEMAKQDARAGRGFCFIDPHGDAIEDILASVPKERAEDVIVFDPADIGAAVRISICWNMTRRIRSKRLL